MGILNGQLRPASVRDRSVAAQAPVAEKADRSGDLLAVLAADELAKHRVDVAVVRIPTLKPFDADTVLAAVDSDRLVVTLENHTVVGGLFETVAAEAVRRGVHRQIVPVALPDEFLAAGALPTLHDRYGRRIGARTAVASLLTSKC